jgi:hypothetical protein
MNSSDTIRVMKLRYMTRNDMHRKFQSLKGRDHLVDLGVDGMILKWNLENLDGTTPWNGFIWFRIEVSGGSCENGNEILVSV